MFNVSLVSLIGLRFCCLPRKIFLLGQSGIFSCAQRYSVSQFDNAKVITFRCGSRMRRTLIARILRIFCAVTMVMVILVKIENDHFDLDHFDHKNLVISENSCIFAQ